MHLPEAEQQKDSVVRDFLKKYRVDLIEVPEEFKDLAVPEQFKPSKTPK
jgi:hypothetical protein